VSSKIKSKGSFGERLRQTRKQAGLTQQELAKLAGVATRSISQYETDSMQPRSETIQVLAKVLNVNPIWLAASAPQPAQNNQLLQYEVDQLAVLSAALPKSKIAFLHGLSVEHNVSVGQILNLFIDRTPVGVLVAIAFELGAAHAALAQKSNPSTPEGNPS